jgi:hypothetical protein
MSQELGQLLLKALNGLPVEEQGELLVQLLDRSAPVGPMLLDGDPGLAMSDAVFAAARDIRVARRTDQRSPAESGLKVLPVRIPAADYERLREWSRDHDVSMAVIVRTLVERFLDGQERKP